MRAQELVNKVRDVAINYKTLYVYACFGAPLNASNKQRYTNNCDYNRQASRRNKINAASSDTFGFDCVNLIKGILWGWRGDLNHIYGGAVYGSNGCPDTNANGMFWDYCHDQSSDFSNIIPGEFVWMEGHIGVYIGDGYVVECTPIWNDGVQITYLGNWGGSRPGYSTRTWTSHGKSNLIDYSDTPTPPAPTPTLKYSVGQEVTVSGQLFATSDGEGAGKVVDHLDTVITRAVSGKPYPYNFTDDIGWMAEQSVTPRETPAPIPQPTELQEGDTVIITGYGNGSSYGDSNRAGGIGWERTILKIWRGRKFPYQVGNETGTTGFYQADALRKK